MGIRRYPSRSCASVVILLVSCSISVRAADSTTKGTGNDGTKAEAGACQAGPHGRSCGGCRGTIQLFVARRWSSIPSTRRLIGNWARSRSTTSGWPPTVRPPPAPWLETISEYQHRRACSVRTADSQIMLAKWCEIAGLADQAKMHWRAAMSTRPKLNQQARDLQQARAGSLSQATDAGGHGRGSKEAGQRGRGGGAKVEAAADTPARRPGKP